MAVSIAACAATYGASVPVYWVPTSVLTPLAGTYDDEPVLPMTVVGLVMVSVAPPAGPTSTPKLAASPMSTGPGPLQLARTGGSAAVTVNIESPKMRVVGSVALIVVVPTAFAVASPLEPGALLMVAEAMCEGVQVTDVVRSCVVASVYVPVAINC